MPDDQLATMWQSLVNKVASDERVTPHLKGHLELAVPKGVLEDTLYIEVPNEITRAMLQQRLKGVVAAPLPTQARHGGRH